MVKIWNCRRSMLAMIGIACLTGLGIYHGEDISGIAIAISGIIGAVAGSNAWEKRAKSEYGEENHIEDK